MNTIEVERAEFACTLLSTVCRWDSRAEAFSYNKRIMDWAMGQWGLLTVVAVRGVNNVCVMNTLNSSTPPHLHNYLDCYQLLT